jgi:hypothetical protein
VAIGQNPSTDASSLPRCDSRTVRKPGRKPGRKPWAGELLPRVQEILATRPQGMTVKEIADAVREEPRTIQNLVYRAKGKFDNVRHGIWALAKPSPATIQPDFIARARAKESQEA